MNKGKVTERYSNDTMFDKIMRDSLSELKELGGSEIDATIKFSEFTVKLNITKNGEINE